MRKSLQAYRIAIFLTLFLITNSLSASPVLLLEEMVNLESMNKVDQQIPNPLSLHPQWWNYFNVENEELDKRVADTIASLQKLYTVLPIEEQNASLAIMNKIMTALDALPNAHIKEAATENAPPYLSTYSLEKQLDLNKQARKLNEEIILDSSRITSIHETLTKTQKNLDNLMVGYLGQTQPSPVKLQKGLEIMLLGVNTAVGELRYKAAITRQERQKEKLKLLENELAYSKQHLDVREFNEKELENTITFLEKELEKTVKELSKIESYLLGSLTDSASDHNSQLFLEQQLLHAHVNQAYAWANLAFQTFKYNLVMFLNQRFESGKNEFRQNLVTWVEKLNEIKQQTATWQASSIKEQDRIRKEYSSLIALNEPADSKIMKSNQFQQKEVLNYSATIELLKDKIADTEWLINLLDMHFQTHSGFFENLWVTISSFVHKTWTDSLNLLNFSLFKVSGIPITLLALVKMALICAGTFWVSITARKTLISFGKQRSEFSDSTLHIFGSLARYFILLIGVILCFWTIGFDFSNLIFIIGALLFGISFGLQSIANNIFCGLRILLERKVQIGDDIELHSGQHGKVEEIHIQNTVVCTSDGQKVIIPNSEIIGNTLINWPKNTLDYRRLHIPFSVSACNDKNFVRDIVIKAANRVPCTLRNLVDYSEPQVWLIHFDHHVMQFELVVWIDYSCDTFTDSKEADFLWEIDTAMRENDVALPSTIYDLLMAKTAHTNLSHNAQIKEALAIERRTNSV